MGIEEAGNSAVGGFGGQRGGQRSGAPYGEKTSGDAGCRAVSDFSESEIDNADVIEQGDAQMAHM